MAINKKSSSFNKILLIVFGAAFGLVALALGYQAVKDSSDIRSRAATEGDVYKTWEFVESIEGWKAAGQNTLAANSGILSLTVKDSKKVPTLTQTAARVDMPQGKKYIVLYAGLDAGATPRLTPTLKPFVPPAAGTMVTDVAIDDEDQLACTLDAKSCPDGTYVSRMAPNCQFAPCANEKPIGIPKIPTVTPLPGSQAVTLQVYYKLSGQKWVKTPIVYQANLNRKVQRLSIALPDTLPEVGPVNIEKIRIVFSSVKVGQSVLIDRVQLIGARVKNPTPKISEAATPTPGPVKLFTVNVTGNMPKVQMGQSIPLVIDVKEPNGTAGTPSEGFNVQVYLLSMPSMKTISGHNAAFDAATGMWRLTVVPEQAGTHRFQVSAYCAVDDSSCASTYGKARQVTWEYDFEMLGAPKTSPFNPTQ